MRDTQAEKAFLTRLFAWAGFLTLFGIFVLAVGTEVWLIVNVLPMDWTLFWVLQGAWFIVLGVTLATVTALARRGSDQL